MSRSPQDWEALKRAEQKGHEAPGTFQRLWDEDQAREAAEKKARMESDLAEARRLEDELKKSGKK